MRMLRWRRRPRRDLSSVLAERLAREVNADLPHRGTLGAVLEIDMACDDLARALAGLPSAS